MIDPTTPFVLLDDAGSHRATSRLFRHPAAIITADRSDQVDGALAAIRAALAGGWHVAGYVAYEAGNALVSPREGHDVAPLLWFGVFDGCDLVPSADIPGLLPDPAGAWTGPPQPTVSREAYGAALARVQTLIAAGDIYQANLTFRAEVPVEGHPLALYARMRGASAARWGGVVFTGARWLLSLSPELFFTLSAGEIVARPMKGTAARARATAADAAAVSALVADPKQRAENLMIVDLLRNDLSRVAQAGSVAVPCLFEVETYPTIHQMTSTVTARLVAGLDAVDVLRAAFPCGSITGAPKRRAMEVIAGVERDARGAYTGSIGHIAPDGDAAFNVAIRTLTLEEGEAAAMLGLGSGVVADSQADEEWRECLAKGAFVTAGNARFDLIETMRFDPFDGLLRLPLHMTRLRASADRLGFRLDPHGLLNELQAATFTLRDPARVRLRVSPGGGIAIECTPLPAAVALARVALAPLPVATHDYRLRHKTSDRAFYDDARRAAGTFELLFVDAHGFVTEGSFTNVFVERDGRLLTPPAVRGLLPGVLRAALIEEGRAVEAELRPSDLAGGLLIGNALRGLIPARLVAAAEGSTL